MNKEEKEKIKSFAVSWGIAILIAILIAIICICAAHNKGTLQVAHADIYSNMGNIAVGQEYSIEQYITPTGDCTNSLTGNGDQIEVYFPQNGITSLTSYDTLSIEVDIDEGYCQIYLYGTDWNGWILYSKYDENWEFESWYTYDENNDEEYQGFAVDNISIKFLVHLDWGNTGTNATNAQGTLESILGVDGETPTPELSPTPSLGDTMSINVNFMSETFPYDTARSSLYAFEVENAEQHLTTPEINSGEGAMPLGCYMRILYRVANSNSPSGYVEQHTGVLRCATINGIYYIIACVPDVAVDAKIQFTNSPYYTSQQLYENAYTVSASELEKLKANYTAQDSYGSGFNEGYDTGYANGKQAAENLLGIYAGMDLVTGIFAHIGELLNTPLIGSIPIYVFILIPLILGVVYVVLKFVR